jgi:5,10-methylenetetrahydromethanopterin reductase
MARKLKGIGFIFTTMLNPREITRFARMMEDAGFTELWLGDSFLSGNHHYRSYVPVATQVLLSTTQLRVGVGVTSPHIRHPALLASEWATLDEMSGGRFRLGLGTMNQSLERMGFDPKRVRSVAYFRQSIELIKALGSGRPIETDFPDLPYTYRSGVLGFEPHSRSVPIYLGVQNPRMLRLCGEIADGLTSSESNLPAYVKHVIGTVKDAAQASGRDAASLEYLAFPVISLADSAEEAEIKVLERVCSRVAREQPPAFMSHTGLQEEEISEIKRLFRQGQRKEAEGLVTKKMISLFAIAGTTETCVERLLELADAGLDRAILMLPPQADVERDIRQIADNVLPHVL